MKKICWFLSILLFVYSSATASPSNDSVQHVRSYAKDSLLNGVWIGPEGICLEIRDIAAFLTIDYRHRKTMIEVNDSILNMNKAYTFSAENSVQPNRGELFRILLHTQDTLLLQPINENAKKLFNADGEILFVNRKHFINAVLSFQKLYFCNHIGYKDKPKSSAEIEVSNDRTIRFKGKSLSAKYNGSFTGKLSVAQADSLQELLKWSALGRFSMSHKLMMYDAPIYTFRIHYNNDIATGFGQIIPYYAIPLRDFLDALYKRVELAPSPEDFQFEK